MNVVASGPPLTKRGKCGARAKFRNAPNGHIIGGDNRGGRVETIYLGEKCDFAIMPVQLRRQLLQIGLDAGDYAVRKVGYRYSHRVTQTGVESFRKALSAGDPSSRDSEVSS